MSDFGVDDLHQVLGFVLSDEQLRAVTADVTAPLLVAAGAGCGKTTVMAARVIWAVGTAAVSPDRVMGLTYTTKAAGELGSRIRRDLERLDQHSSAASHAPAPGDAADPYVATYHAFAHRLITEHGLRRGLEPGLRVLGSVELTQLAYRVLRETAAPLAGLATRPDTLVQQLIELDTQMAEHEVTSADLRDYDRDLIADIDQLAKPGLPARQAREAAELRRALALVVDEFRVAKLAVDGLDYSDMMRFAGELARGCPEIGASLREQFQLVLLDEYQDTSVSQQRMLSALFGGGHSVTAVGDPLQAIYGWRGAAAGNVELFPEHFPDAADGPARQLTLTHSRRCGANVLASANVLAGPLRLSTGTTDLQPSADHPGDGVRCALLESYVDELDWVADRIGEQVRAGVRPAEIAVLCRAGSDFPAVARALRERGIPAAILAVEGLLSEPAVIEAHSVLRLLHDPAANTALVRLLAGSRWRIGVRDLALLGRRAAALAASEQGGTAEDEAADHLTEAMRQAVAGVDPVDVVSLCEAMEDPGPQQHFPYSARARERFAALAAELHDLRRHASAPVDELLARVVAVTGLAIEAAVAGDGAADALAAFADLAAGWNDLDGETDLGSFLAWLAAAERFDTELVHEPSARADAVRLLTAHSAKGLEWDVVAVPFLAAGVFPSSRSRSLWTRRACVLPHDLRGDRHSLPVLREHSNSGYAELAAGNRAQSEAEERRLAYVAATRARRLLLASGHHWGPVQVRPRGPSPYLDAIRESALDGMGRVDSWVRAPADGERNPGLAVDRAAFAWPPPVDEAEATLRAAVRLVRDEIEHPTLTDPELDEAEQSLADQWDRDAQVLLGELRDRAGEPVIALPSTMATSDVVSLVADPQDYGLRLQRPMPRRPARAARRGTRFHSWVEQRLGQRPLFEDYAGAGDADVFGAGDLAELQAGFLATPYANRTPFALEVPFAMVLGGRVITGRIDAVYRTGSDDDARAPGPGQPGWEVVDWKTHQRANADPLQLAIYRLAWAQLCGADPEDVAAVFVYVARGEVEVVSGLPDRAELELLIRGGAAGQDRQ